MSTELTRPQDASIETVRHLLSQLRGTEERQKQILLELYEIEAHKILNYASWEEFADREFAMAKSRFYQLLSAARVCRILDPSLYSQQSKPVSTIVDTSSTNPSTSSLSDVPDICLIELARLKDPTAITTAWKEATESAPFVTYRGQESRRNGKVSMTLVKRIVDRMLAPTLPAKPAPAPSSPARNDAPPPDRPFAAPTTPSLPAKTFSPPPDEDLDFDEEEGAMIELDFEEAIVGLETVMVWLQNREIGDNRQVRSFACRMLRETLCWAETQP